MKSCFHFTSDTLHGDYQGGNKNVFIHTIKNSFTQLWICKKSNLPNNSQSSLRWYLPVGTTWNAIQLRHGPRAWMPSFKKVNDRVENLLDYLVELSHHNF
jgi:hypothetical protein